VSRQCPFFVDGPEVGGISVSRMDDADRLFKPGSKAEAIRNMAKKQEREDARREWWTANRPKENKP